jgi:beta-lactamase regulating signal transducer with metallopeptidase domain
MTQPNWILWVIENSVIVILLAWIAEFVSRRTKNPRIANLLWIVVIAKFMMPSFLSFELPLLPADKSLKSTAPVTVRLQTDVYAVPALTPRNRIVLPIASSPNNDASRDTEPATINNMTEVRTSIDNRPVKISWFSIIGIAWVSGSLIWFVMFGLRLRKFRLGLRSSWHAEETLQELAKQIAMEFRVSRAPEIHIVSAEISPMLWSRGWNAQILLPANMLETTSRDGMSAVLAHEMAHLKRRDQWVQGFALLVLGVYWWHPVSWYAVKRLRQTQDACCDIDVVTFAPKLRVEFAQTLVDVADKLRTNPPPFALAFLDPYSLRARVQAILQESPHARLSSYKSRALLLIGFTLTNISATIVAESPHHQVANQINDASETVDADENPELADETPSKSQDEIEVLEPDGSIPSNAKYLIGRRHDQFQLDDLMEPVQVFPPGKACVTRQVEQGKIVQDFDPADEFIAVWSDHGFFQTSIPRLATAKSIQLQGWVTLEIDLRTKERPDNGATISVSNGHTSDGRNSAMTFRNEKVIADKNGNAVIKRVAPGGINIQTNVVTMIRGNTGWDQFERSRIVDGAAGKTLQLTFGGSGRNIIGSIAFPKDSEENDFEDLKGEIECLRTNERIRIDIAVDGNFDCDEVPAGPCKISIRSISNSDRRGLRGGYSGTKSFDCEAIGNDALSIGTVALERTGQVARNSASVERNAVDDDFSSTTKVAVVATVKLERSHYVLLDDRGSMIRSLDNIEVPGAWAFNFQFVAFDINRDRLYLLSAYDRSTNSQTIFQLNLSGKILQSWSQRTSGECRLAVDAKTGDLWVLNIGSIDNAKTQVFDQNGNLTKTYSHAAFCLCYSHVDNAFWFAGSRSVFKVDPANGESIAEYALPRGGFTVSNVIPDPEAGVWAFEQMHPDMPKSANRVWRVDSNAKPVASVDVGNVLVHSAVCVGNELWCSGVTVEGLWIAKPIVRNAFLSFNRRLETLPDRKFDYSFLGAENGGKQIWALQGTELYKITKDQDGPMRIHSVGSMGIEAPIWVSGHGE